MQRRSQNLRRPRQYQGARWRAAVRSSWRRVVGTEPDLFDGKRLNRYGVAIRRPVVRAATAWRRAGCRRARPRCRYAQDIARIDRFGLAARSFVDR